MRSERVEGINQDVKVKCVFYIVQVNIQAGIHVLSKMFTRLVCLHARVQT